MKSVVGDVELLPQGFETFHYPVCQLKGSFPLGQGGFFNLLAVFVGTGQEKDIVPTGSLVACQDIAGQGCVRVADVGDIVDVVNGCRNIKGFTHVSLLGVFLSLLLSGFLRGLLRGRDLLRLGAASASA